MSETQVRVALRAGKSLTLPLLRHVPDPAPVVPDGARLLPVTCRPAVPRPVPAVVAAAARTRTRPVVTAEYVPEDPVPGPDDVPAEYDDEVPEGNHDVPAELTTLYAEIRAAQAAAKETVAALGRVHARLGILKERPRTTSGPGEDSPDKASPWFGPEEDTSSQNA